MIDQVEMISLEGQRYLIRVTLNQRPLILSDHRGQSLLFRSARQAREQLEGLCEAPMELVHSSAYSEMVGLDQAPLEPMRIPLRGRR